MHNTIKNKLKEAFEPYLSTSLEAWETFVDLGEVVYIKSQQVIKKPGDKEKYLSFILNGSGGILLWNKNNFVCIDLCYEGEFFGDYMSFLTNKPSELEVIAFEPLELFRISKSNFNNLIKDSDYGNLICRYASEALFIHKQTQQIEIITKTPTERYLDLLEKQPKIVLRTPLKFIASYLGITPQSLSRIRKSLADNH